MYKDCLGCEWYNKPYWSIISPCTNCSKRFKEKPIKVTNYSINIDKSDLYEQIENLQQENQQLKEINEEHKKLNGKLREENKKYKEVIDKAINNSQYWIDYYTRLNSDERISLRLQENIDILKEVE